MPPLRIVHTADFHLGARLREISEPSPGDGEGERLLKAAEKSIKNRLREIQAKEEELSQVNKSITSLEKEHQAYDLLYGEVFHEKGCPLDVLIGFAIRLGVAKAVAERSVAHAPRFLIIDEGFGPLSREFKEEVIKTLSELSQDYEKIIVISHVDEVKESQLFATQIQVTKDSSGHSHLNIVKW